MNMPKKVSVQAAGAIVILLAGVLPSGAQGEKNTPSLGSFQGALSIRAKLPPSFAPSAAEGTLKDGVLVMKLHLIVMTNINVEETVLRDGRSYKIVRTVTQYKAVSKNKTVSVKSIKPFVVTKEGKLEPFDTGKLADNLKKPTALLVGDVDPDPRNFDLVRAGTIYLAVPGLYSIPGPQIENDKGPPPKDPGKDK